ncbi:helix-turn-helix domain-containing protein [Promicromonospora citrea]|nr:helix-turn-helix domain-containing protein [Promicromonospora citrea]
MSTTHSPEGPMDRSAPLWTLDELCAFLRTTPATVHTWRKSGRGPRAYRVGRHLLFAELDVRAWLAERADRMDDAGHADADGSGW